MSAALLGLVLTGITVVAASEWRVGQGHVRVICPMTIGGSFEAKTTAIKGTVISGANGARPFSGSVVVDLRTLDTGIGLRNEHLREKYLEVNKTPGFDTATLSELDLIGLDPEAPEGKGSFAGSLTVHGVTKKVTGPVEVHEAGGGLRVKASFAVDLVDYGIAKPRYLGIGVTNVVQVEVAFDVSR